jgi:N-acetylglucosaminyl-diphospho-decaprenol L-rhamnosyltransferase
MAAGAPFLTFVIVTFNSAEVIGGCLDSIYAHDRRARCIVVDNASTDDTRHLVGAYDGPVDLVPLESNEGFGRACNIGARRSQTDLVATMNPDVRIGRFAPEEISELAAADRVGLLSPLLCEASESPRQGARRCAPMLSRSARTGLHDWRHIVGPLWPSRLPTGDLSVEAEESATWASGAMTVFARQEFLELGGFDPSFFLYYEDMDLGRAYRAAGLPIRLLDSLEIQHEPGSSSPRGGQEAKFMTWAMLGWLEFVAKYEGHRAAVGAGRRILAGFSLLTPALCQLARLTRRPRLVRKSRQYEEIRRTLNGIRVGDLRGLPDGGFYSRAIGALATVER